MNSQVRIDAIRGGIQGLWPPTREIMLTGHLKRIPAKEQEYKISNWGMWKICREKGRQKKYKCALIKKKVVGRRCINWTAAGVKVPPSPPQGAYTVDTAISFNTCKFEDELLCCMIHDAVWARPSHRLSHEVKCHTSALRQATPVSCTPGPICEHKRWKEQSRVSDPNYCRSCLWWHQFDLFKDHSWFHWPFSGSKVKRCKVKI